MKNLDQNSEDGPTGGAAGGSAGDPTTAPAPHGPGERPPKRPQKRPWWRNEWIVTIAIVGVLYATGLLVHVQATLQRIVLATGLLRPDYFGAEGRVAASPGLVAVDADGILVSTAALHGEVVFINAWATWCAPCIAEMPAIDAVYRDYGSRVRFIMLNLDEDEERARKFMSDFALPLHRPAGPIPAWFDVSLIPSTVVIARDGTLAAASEGMAQYDSASFREALDRLLAETP